MKPLQAVAVAMLAVLAACGGSLVDKMELTTSCTGGSLAHGEVTNRSDSTVTIAIHVDFLDHSGAVVTNGLGQTGDVPPGGSADWKASNIRGVAASDCRAKVSAVFRR